MNTDDISQMKGVFKLRYTETLEAINADHTKVFRACSADGWDCYQLDGSDLYINTTYDDGMGSPVSFLSYRMMQLDWKEVTEDENE